MKYIITDSKDVIMHISDTIGYQSNGNVLIDNDTLAIAKPLVKEVYAIEEVSDNVTENKYCYTETDGFYKNENYVEPVNEKTEIEQLKEQVTDLQLALAELVEGGNV